MSRGQLARSAVSGIALLALSYATAACGDGGPAATPDGATFSGAPYAVVSSDSGKLRIELRAASAGEPTRGTNLLELTVLDATTGAARDGLAIDVVPWMTAMGHGASVVPSVEARGNGQYVVSNVALYMPGRWEIRTDVHEADGPAGTGAGSLNDHAAPTVDVP